MARPPRNRLPARPGAIVAHLRAVALAALLTGAGWATGWAAASSPAVLAARDDLRAAREALAAARSGLHAEVTLRPRLDLLARDDPPRPRSSDFELAAGASLSWAPLRSEVLLHEARVLEAELRVVDARRDAAVAELGQRVQRARAVAAERRVEAAWQEAAGTAAARAGSAAEADAAAGAETARRRAELDLQKAALDLADARRDLRDSGGASRHDSNRDGSALDGATRAPERPDLQLPPVPETTSLRAFRAREFRSAAEVVRAERRRIGAFVPNVGLDMGYAGADASVAGGLALRHGRPHGSLEASWSGTPQERAWARFTMTLRFGSDARDAASSPEDLRREAQAALEDLTDALARKATAAREEAEARRARWRLAEARLELAREEGDEGRVDRALDVARREWLRFLRATEKALDAMEAPLQQR